MEKLSSLNLCQLIGLIHKKKVACFGTGIQGKRVAQFFFNWHVSDHLIAYIDNDESKIGDAVNCEAYKYPIYSLNEACQKLGSDILILVTCLDYQAVYEQLEKISEKDWSYIAIDEVAQEQLMVSNYPAIIKETEKPVIPKIIHYAWLGKEMPEILKRNVDHWKELCPDYQFYEWNEKNYDISSNQYMKQAYDRKIWGFVPDYMRLDVVYKYGGIYLDTDIEMIKNPDELLYQECFGCVDSSMTMNLGSGFGAMPQSDIIKELRDYYEDISFVGEDGKIDNTSCNTHSYQVLKKYGIKINDQLQNVHGMNIYPMIFQGACQYTRMRRVTEKTYWVHYGNMSWFREKGKLQ